MSPPTTSVLALTWEHHRRMRELCEWLGLPLRVLTSPHRALRRYLELSRETLRLLRRERPRAVFIQNPSLVLATLVLAARPFLGRYRVVVDAHNEAVTPFTYARWPVTWLARRALRLADATVVTNAALAEIVRAHGGRPLVLPDRLPSAPVEPNCTPPGETLQVMVIATYAAAARALGPTFKFAFTGNPSRLAPALRSALPDNVRLTGFLPEHEYWQLMADSHVALDLTLKPNCLVCGAYEALSLRKPMVLSGNPASRDLFGRVALFPREDRAADIADTLRETRARHAELLEQLAREAPRFAEQWTVAAGALRDSLGAASIVR
jgi:hypothetical protein